MSAQQSSSPEPVPSSEGDAAAQVSSLKRRLHAKQQELDQMAGLKAKKFQKPVTMGRGIRRLITLYESIDDLIDEADRRFQAEVEGEDEVFNCDDEKRAADRNFASYKALLYLVPSLKTVIEDPNFASDDMQQFISDLQRGANDARSDDVRRVKEELACWLNQDYSPTLNLIVKSRNDRGLQHYLTGRLLTSIEHDWDNEQIRADIRGGQLDVSEDYFLGCLYPKGSGDPNNLEKNFLRSSLLVKTYSAIFTSPSSSEAFDKENEEGPARKAQKTNSQRKATKNNVASLLKMEGKVTPRSIAYAAVMLVFNLTDASHWVEVYNGFSFRAFYNFVIDFFEHADGPRAQKRADNLLKWWNGQVFPHHVAATATTNKSRKKLAAQRALLEQNDD